MDYDSAVLYDRKRRIIARKARLRDHETAFQTAKKYWNFRDIDTLMSQGPDSRRGEPTLSPANAVNATGKVRREWKGMRGHSYKARRSQIVNNSQGKNVVVMTRADRDKAMQAKFGSIHTD